ncbi:hypothetical protein [Vibrio parahaemolyticus]|uniref:hypothetical protein n=1 Tax=Vibrio parahaemolyticus TaxID=670 RepID=UPI001482FB63|nr:hypothetical protein [Vibrio parahaemolyticus]
MDMVGNCRTHWFFIPFNNQRPKGKVSYQLLNNQKKLDAIEKDIDAFDKKLKG